MGVYVNPINDAKVGDIITFGKYEWLVLEKTSDTVLVITKDIICNKEYNEEDADITWEECTLRSWLNKEFYNEFTVEEKAVIMNTYVENNNNFEYGTAGGRDTTDKIFLLSIAEVNKYFKDDKARIAYTDDVQYKILDEGRWFWWLRSPGYIAYYAAFVYSDGIVSDYGSFVIGLDRGVRPALNLKF